MAHSVEAELKRVPGTREVVSTGGPGRAVRVEIDPTRMASTGVTVPDLRAALQSANLGLPVGELLSGNRAVAVESGPFLKDAREVAELVVGVRDGKPVFLQDVATVATGRCPLRATSGTASAARAAASSRPSRSASPRSPARTPSTSPTR